MGAKSAARFVDFTLSRIRSAPGKPVHGPRSGRTWRKATTPPNDARCLQIGGF